MPIKYEDNNPKQLHNKNARIESAIPATKIQPKRRVAFWIRRDVKNTTNSEKYIQNDISEDVINNVRSGSEKYKNYILEIVEKIEKDNDLNEQYKFIQDNFYDYENWKLWHYGPLKKNGVQNLRVYKENDIELGFLQAQEILKERGLKLLDISDPAVNSKAIRIVLGSLKHEFNQEKETLWHGFNKLK